MAWFWLWSFHLRVHWSFYNFFPCFYESSHNYTWWYCLMNRNVVFLKIKIILIKYLHTITIDFWLFVTHFSQALVQIMIITEMVPYLIWALDFLVSKKFGPREIWARKNLGPKKFGPEKFGLLMKMLYNDFHAWSKFLWAQISRGPVSVSEFNDLTYLKWKLHN